MVPPMAKMTNPQNPQPHFIESGHRTAQNLRSTLVGIAVIATLGLLGLLLVSHPSVEQFLRSTSAFEYLEPKPPTILNGIIAIGSLAIATFAFVPILGLFAANAIVFGPLWGSAYSLVGVSLAGGIQFTMGRILHQPVLAKFRSGILTVLRRKFSRAGPWPIAVLRVVPVAPFVVINVIAGALKIRLSDFLIGNFLGSSLPVIGTGIVVFEMQRIVQTKNLRNYLLLVLVLSTAAFFAMRVRRGLKSRGESAS